jgi:DNA-binding winged helix-turn-helix (wHTH) protein/tetratricopeptide (TPR) repeat protein
MLISKTAIYRFGEFELTPRARELRQNGELINLTASTFDCLVYLVEHRDRPVGKDELIAAVWGSVDVSDNLLAQTIVRLRRVVGDNAEEGRCIKTLPRVGYRWMMDTTIQTADHVQGAGDGHGEFAPLESRRSAPRTVSRRRWRVLWIATVLLVAAALGYGWFRAHQRAPVMFNQGTVAVLPAKIDASDEWAWLRLGLMDLIAGDLRGARIPVESSEITLSLLNEPSQGAGQFSSYALVIHPHVTLADGVWSVQLEADAPNGTPLRVEASSDNVLKAAHSANALLMAQMGASQSTPATSVDAKEQYLVRMEAAASGGSANVLRGLIDNAPEELQQSPAFSFAKASFYCDQGEYEPCKRQLAELLPRLPADTQPTLRGRALVQQWYVYSREHKYAEGVDAITEGIRLLQKQNNTAYLAHAYAQRAELYRMLGKLDNAESDFGIARINYTLAGETSGALGIDEALAELDMQRGHFAQALPTIRRAYAQYLRTGMRQYLPDLLIDMVFSQRMLLQHTDALATTEQYWPLDQRRWDYAEDITNHVLIFQRAQALAGVGRTVEAGKLLEQLLSQIKLDPHGEPGLEGTVYVALAELALQRGETGEAQSWIKLAFGGHLLDANSDMHDHANAWLVKVAAFRQAGDLNSTRDAVAAMQAWATQLSTQDDWIDIDVLRARAIGAAADGQHEQALADLKDAMAKANRLGVPDKIVDVGLTYTLALLDGNQVGDATAISGQLSAWEASDWRAAWAQACVYRAMGRMDSWAQYQRKARELAGDRVLPKNAGDIVP